MTEEEELNNLNIEKLKDDKYYLTIDEVLDKIGYTKFHIIMIIIVAISLAVDGIEMYLIYLLAPVLKKLYNLGDSDVSLLVSILFMGIAVGAICSGILFKKYGRKRVMLYSLIINTIFGTTCILVDNILWFLTCRFIIGMSIGILLNFTNALCEILPKKYRDFIMGSIYFYFKLGIIYFVLIFFILTEDTDPVYNYKWIIILSSIPMLICLPVALIYYEESPRILIMNQNNYEEGFKIINKIGEGSNYTLTEKDKNGIINEAERFRENGFSNEDSPIKVFFSLFNKKYLKLSLLVISLWVCNNTVLYTNLYSLPIILHKTSSGMTQNVTLLNETTVNSTINNTYKSDDLIVNDQTSNSDKLFSSLNNKISQPKSNLSNEEILEKHNEMKKILIANLIPLPGEFIAGYLTSLPSFGRKYSIATGFFFEVLFSLLMIVHSQYLHIYSSMIIVFNTLSYNITKLYTCEAYNTNKRDMATSASSFTSRMAAIFIPLIASFTFTFTVYGPCIFIAIIALLGCILSLMLPFDTYSKPLDCDKTTEDTSTNKEKVRDEEQ